MSGAARVAAAAAGAGLVAQQLAERADARRFPAPGSRLDASGHRLHLWSMGEHRAGPAVILESGIWSTCLDWCRVQPRVAQFTRVYSYDRAGFGWSDTGRGGRTAADRVKDLHALLAANVAPPYILVGHSYGGLIVRLFAAHYPREVAAMVLIDATPADLFEHRPDYIRSLYGDLRRQQALSLLAPFGIPRLLLAAGFDPSRALAYPPEVRPVLRALHGQTRVLRECRREGLALLPSMRQVREGASSAMECPLVVLSRRMSEDPGDGEMPDIWHTLQRDPLALSPQSRQMFGEKGGHYIQIDEPELVVEAIRSLLVGMSDTVRRSRS